MKRVLASSDLLGLLCAAFILVIACATQTLAQEKKELHDFQRVIVYTTTTGDRPIHGDYDVGRDKLVPRVPVASLTPEVLAEEIEWIEQYSSEDDTLKNDWRAFRKQLASEPKKACITARTMWQREIAPHLISKVAVEFQQDLRKVETAYCYGITLIRHANAVAALDTESPNRSEETEKKKEGKHADHDRRKLKETPKSTDPTAGKEESTKSGGGTESPTDPFTLESVGEQAGSDEGTKESTADQVRKKMDKDLENVLKICEQSPHIYKLHLELVEESLKDAARLGETKMHVFELLSLPRGVAVLLKSQKLRESKGVLSEAMLSLFKAKSQLESVNSQIKTLEANNANYLRAGRELNGKYIAVGAELKKWLDAFVDITTHQAKIKLYEGQEATIKELELKLEAYSEFEEIKAKRDELQSRLSAIGPPPRVAVVCETDRDFYEENMRIRMELAFSDAYRRVLESASVDKDNRLILRAYFEGSGGDQLVELQPKENISSAKSGRIFELDLSQSNLDPSRGLAKAITNSQVLGRTLIYITRRRFGRLANKSNLHEIADQIRQCGLNQLIVVQLLFPGDGRFEELSELTKEANVFFITMPVVTAPEGLDDIGNDPLAKKISDLIVVQTLTQTERSKTD